MRLTRSMLLILIGTGVSIAVLRASVIAFTPAQDVAGCPALTTDGRVDPTQTVAFWMNQLITPNFDLASAPILLKDKILGKNSDEKWIEVDLGKQKMIAHQGNTVFLETLISSGLWGKTVPGEFKIWYKIRSTKMEGGNKALGTYYYLPNVPYTMFFNNDIGIHGTYWHQNFGQPMSHGCVNTPTPMAERLFYWTDPPMPDGVYAVRSTDTNPGTRVVVHP